VGVSKEEKVQRGSKGFKRLMVKKVQMPTAFKKFKELQI